MKFERVHHVRLHEQIVSRFVEMAEAGALKPDDRLPPERELLNQLGVSRQALREALTVMESKGMISTTPGGGRVFLGQGTLDAEALYSALQDSALFEILTAREAIECKTAELAALHATDNELEGLRHRLTELGSDSYSVEWNYGFHLAIAEASHNTVLHNLLQLLIQARHDVHGPDYLTLDQLAALFDQHASVLDAIESRNGDAARDAMRRHIVNTREAFEARRAERDTEQSSPAHD